MKKIYLIAALLIAGALYSCSPTTKTEAPAEAEASTETAAGQSAVSDDVSEKDVVKVAAGSPDHITLVKALKAADLVNALSNAGPFTVFAPTDAAFAKLPEGTLEDLTKPENITTLQDILQYHVSVGVYKIENFTDGQVLGQVNGGNIALSVKDGKVSINNGQANVITSVKASNGIIHVIDGVLTQK